MSAVEQAARPSDAGEFSDRQREVLDATLQQMVESGDALTMEAIARRASCSKETLYKWFGDRDGLLNATVQWQAGKVKLPTLDRDNLDAASLREGLAAFAESWLTVLTSQTSIALNSMAISQSSASRGDLGQIVLTNGPLAIARRVKPVLQLARDAGLIEFDDIDGCFRTFFGLVVRDVQIRALLGDKPLPKPSDLHREAVQAADQFLALYGARKKFDT